MGMDFTEQQVQLHNKKPGYYTLVYCLAMAVLFSCAGKDKSVDPKIAKTVPQVYVNAADPRFSNHQDTVYLGNTFFTGYRYTLYENGDTALLQSYFNGVEEGFQRKWYSNKQLAEERFYINGRKEAVHQGWWPNGKQKFFFEAYDDEYNGEFREWYASGLLGKDFNYVNGHEEGSQRLWWDNGVVRANYVIRDGKKYGMLGYKTCINPYDSVVKK